MEAGETPRFTRAGTAIANDTTEQSEDDDADNNDKGPGTREVSGVVIKYLF